MPHQNSQHPLAVLGCMPSPVGADSAINRQNPTEMPHMTRHTAWIALTAAALAAPMAHADLIGLHAVADGWRYDGNADVAQTGTSPERFELGSQTVPSLALAFEHPLPLLPNVRVQYTTLKGNDTLNSLLFKFDNKVYVGNVNFDLDASTLDLIAYYELLDNVVSVDAGLGAKLIKGDLTASGNLNTTASTVSVNQTIPVVYASATVKLPFTGLSVNATGNGLSFDGSSISDLAAAVQYKLLDVPGFDVGLRAGYRQVHLQLDDVDGIDADATFKGPFLGVQAHF